jgi:hypothetical protein
MARHEPEPLPNLLDHLESLHQCPSCEGKGRRYDRETQADLPCRVCLGTGQVDYDPDDQSIPY